MPQSEIARYEERLKSCMEYHHRVEYAKLFSSVRNQRLHLPRKTVQQEEPGPLDESVVLLEEDCLRQLHDKLHDVVFNKIETDENEIQEYPVSLFPTEELKNIIEGLRNRLKKDTAIFEARDAFGDDSLGWVMCGPLHNDLLKDRQKALLKSSQSDELVRAELCDVLNMMWAELTSWSWTGDDSGLDAEPRKQLNGKYHVVMQEDALQSMLTHYIGVWLYVDAKQELKYWLDTVMIPEAVDITIVEADRQHFYLQYRDKYNGSKSLMSRLNLEFWDDFFLSQLPNSVADTGGYEGDTDLKGDSDSKKPWLQVKQ